MTSQIDVSLTARAKLRSVWILCASAVALAACTSSGPKVTMVQKTSKPKEYFSEKDYGVKASPRVVNVAMVTVPGMKMKRLPRGGGRDQIGKPYKVKGKWYYPKEELPRCRDRFLVWRRVPRPSDRQWRNL
jgi:rare lipoprotein A